jgi:hypothetical protein
MPVVLSVQRRHASYVDPGAYAASGVDDLDGWPAAALGCKTACHFNGARKPVISWAAL